MADTEAAALDILSSSFDAVVDEVSAEVSEGLPGGGSGGAGGGGASHLVGSLVKKENILS